ncbi:MAG: HEAT repeat domain-containing protein [Elusimicrobiota bacterium]
MKTTLLSSVLLMATMFYFRPFCFSQSAQKVILSTEPQGVEVSTIVAQPPKSNIEKLKDFDPNIRKNAVIFLGIEQNSNNLPHLLKMLKDKNGEVRRVAIEACVRSGSTKKVAPAILELLKVETEVGPLNTAINSLGQMKYTEALAEIKKNASHPYPTVRTYSVKALSEYNDKETYPLIVEKLLDPAEGVRLESMKAVVKLNIKTAEPNLIKNLKYPMEIIRREASKALGETGSSSAKPELLKLTQEKDMSVVLAAKEAIEKINKRSAGK